VDCSRRGCGGLHLVGCTVTGIGLAADAGGHRVVSSSGVCVLHLVVSLLLVFGVLCLL